MLSFARALSLVVDSHHPHLNIAHVLQAVQLHTVQSKARTQDFGHSHSGAINIAQLPESLCTISAYASHYLPTHTDTRTRWFIGTNVHKGLHTLALNPVDSLQAAQRCRALCLITLPHQLGQR